MEIELGGGESRMRFLGLLRSGASWAKVGRESLKVLAARGIPISVEEAREEVFDPAFVLEDKLKRLCCAEHVAAAGPTFTTVVPTHYSSLIAPSEQIFGYYVFEATRWPKEWVKIAADRGVLTFVPSAFCRRGLIESGLGPNQLRYFPHGIDTALYNPSSREKSATGHVRLLYVGTNARRKGLDILARSLREVFDSSSRVAVTIKLDIQPHSVSTINDLDAVIDGLSFLGDGLRVITCHLSETEMAALYKAHDVLCLPHRGEGFGLPILEAMACGTVPIATDWSGPQDFFDSDVGYAIPVRRYIAPHGMIPRSFGCDPDALMAEPDIEALSSTLKQLTSSEGQETIARKSILSAQRASLWSWERGCEDLIVELAQQG